MKTRHLRFPAVLAAMAALSLTVLTLAGALSGTPTVDRGLPTGNLNFAAGVNRSNTAGTNGNDYIGGDDFTVGVAGETWVVTGIRTWSVAGLTTDGTYELGDEFTSVSLYGGPADPGEVSLIANGTGALAVNSDINGNPDITHTQVTYSGGASYESQGGGTTYRLWQHDFDNLNWVVDGGVKYNFAVDGELRTAVSVGYWFNHGSNAALSVSPQQGADDRWIAWLKTDLATPIVCKSDENPPLTACDGGWVKTSDINVQVYATQVPTQLTFTPDPVTHLFCFIYDGPTTSASDFGTLFANPAINAVSELQFPSGAWLSWFRGFTVATPFSIEDGSVLCVAGPGPSGSNVFAP